MTDPSLGSVRAGTAQARWILVATILGSGMVMLDSTVVNVALARIGEELEVGFAGLQWITNAYGLTLASFILLGGVLGDRYGRRRVFVIGTVWFAAASLLCAVSPNEQLLIMSRALQGVGGALLAPGSLAIISSTFAKADRSWAIGMWSGLGGLATALGPFLGGWLVEASWRWVFLINLPLAVAIVIIAIRHVPDPTHGPRPAQRPDLVGATLLVVALGGLALGLTRAGERGWDPTAVVACLVGLLAVVGFVGWERRSTHPLVPLTVFADRVFAVTNVVTAFVYAAVGVYFFLLVFQLQAVGGWTPLAAGAALLPSTALMLILSARFGSLSERTGPRPLLAVGALLMSAGFLLAVRVGPDARYVTDVLPAVVLVGLGLSCLVAPLTATVLGAVPDALAGAASGVNNAVARTAGLLAVVAIPAAAGLSAARLDDAATLQQGYQISLVIGAGLLLVAAVISWLGLPRRVPPAPTPAPGAGPHRRYQCPVSAPALHVD